MENLVKIENNQIVTDSRSVAEHFEKRHDKLIHEINRMYGDYCVEEGTPKMVETPMFFKTTYVHEQNGQTYPMYLMNRDGFSLLVMGFTGKKALDWKLKYINAFNAMEKQLIESRTDSYMIEDPVARAKKWIEEETERQELRKANKEMLPKAEFYDTVASTESLLSMADTAKVLDMGLGRNKLFKFLRNKQILDSYNRPYQRYVDAGYFKLSEDKYMVGDNCVVSTTTLVKQKGVDYIRKLLKKEGIA